MRILCKAYDAFECAVGAGRSIKQIANRTAVTERPIAYDTYMSTYQALLRVRYGNLELLGVCRWYWAFYKAES